MPSKSDLIEIYETSFRNNFDLPALTDYDSDQPTLTYGMMAEQIARLHMLYHEIGIKPGDKIALIGKNSSNWAMVFIATITYGAVIVPVLHEFSPDDVHSILNHSDSTLLFVSESIWRNLKIDAMPAIEGVVSLEDLGKVLGEQQNNTTINKSLSQAITDANKCFDACHTKQSFSPSDIKYGRFDAQSTAVINYTSGTSGFSKGVMLSLDNLAGNVIFGVESKLHYRESRCLSFLPLAHAYGCAFDMLTPLAVGTHITFLGRTPSPRTLVKAFAQVRPSLVLCVPLILEKIYKHMIVPALNKKSVKAALAIPGVDRLIYRQIRHKLIKAFGGQFEEVIVGGAPMNSEVEKFLRKIGFRFTVGYGMTECAPLISYTPWREFVCESSGRILPDIMKVKIMVDESHSDDGACGEILVKGQNVMKGYYKRPDLTAQVLEPDGWLHTGDMGYLDEDGKTILIRGRYKTMILGPSGQNIYPETIEDRLNAHRYISESIVVERDRRLHGLVYPDADALTEEGYAPERHKEALDEAIRLINAKLAPFERISSIEIVDEPFAKTPKKSIKRYLYA